MNLSTEQESKPAPRGILNWAWGNRKDCRSKQKNDTKRRSGLMHALRYRMERKNKHEGSGNESDTDTPSVILEDTQPAEAVQRSMTFKYPTGSSPLPPYTIRRGIGIGGFGEVYFAVSDAGKEVAIKRIQRNLEVEIRGASHCLNLKHANLVSLIDICHDEHGQAWVVMEYIAGLNLREILDQNPQGLPVNDVRKWFTSICSGIGHLHTAGLVHRDIKPGNIFDDLGIIKVGDYGLSKFISASHRGGHTESVGTFHYMAPEIGRGEYGKEIDIYALGILLYELMTGEVPFDGESCHEIIVKHLTATPDLSRIAEPFRSVVARALEKEPAKRYHDVNEMLFDLGWGEKPDEIVDVAVMVDDHPPLVEPIASFVSAPVTAELVEPSEQTNEEPLARAVRQSMSDFGQWWKTLDQTPLVKGILVVLGGMFLLVNAGLILPFLMMIALFYVPYYVIRQMVLHVRQQPTYAQAQRIASTSGYVSKPLTKKQWRGEMRNQLRAKHSIFRMAELSTSGVAAVITASGLATAAGVLGLQNRPVDAVAISPYAWMLGIVLVGSFGILGLGKLWERDEGEPLPRRLVLAGLGTGVGYVAYMLGDYLMFLPPPGIEREIDLSPLPNALYPDGNPGSVAFMAHFALLFAAIRWWRPVDPLRRTRLSLWNVACIAVVSWIVHQLVPIPQPYGMLIAGGMAIAVQLSATWIDQRSASRPTQTAPAQPHAFPESTPNQSPRKGTLI